MSFRCRFCYRRHPFHKMEGSDASTNFDKKTLNLDQANKTIKLETYLIFCKIVKKKKKLSISLKWLTIMLFS